MSQGAHSHHTPQRVAGVTPGGVPLRGGNGGDNSGDGSGSGTGEPSRGQAVTETATTAMTGSHWGGGAAAGDNTNGFMSPDKRPGARVVAAENLPPHRSAMPEGWGHGGRRVDDRAAAAAVTRGGNGGQDIAYGSAAPQAREVTLATPEVSSWEHGGGADGGGGGRSGKDAPGQIAIAGNASLKACRLTAGDGPGVPTRRNGHEVHGAAPVQGTDAAGGGEGDGGVATRGSLVHALHEIARVRQEVSCVCGSCACR